MLLSMFLLSVWNALATILLRVSSLLRRQRPFPVFVKNLQGGSLCIRVDGDTTVSHLRRVVEQRSGLGGVGKHVRLWYGTKCLDTVPDRNATVSSLEIHRDSTLEIRGWLCGGGKTRTKGKTAAASTSGAREPSKWVFVVLRQEDGDDIINNSSIKIKNEEDVSDLKERLREDYSGQGGFCKFTIANITVYGCDKNTYDSHEQWWLESTAKNVDASKLLKLMDRTQLLLYECFLAVVKTPPAASSTRAWVVVHALNCTYGTMEIPHVESVSRLKDDVVNKYSGSPNPNFKANHITVYRGGAGKPPQEKTAQAQAQAQAQLGDSDSVDVSSWYLAIIDVPSQACPVASSSGEMQLLAAVRNLSHLQVDSVDSTSYAESYERKSTLPFDLSEFAVGSTSLTFTLNNKNDEKELQKQFPRFMSCLLGTNLYDVIDTHARPLLGSKKPDVTLFMKGIPHNGITAVLCGEFKTSGTFRDTSSKGQALHYAELILNLQPLRHHAYTFLTDGTHIIFFKAMRVPGTSTATYYESAPLLLSPDGSRYLSSILSAPPECLGWISLPTVVIEDEDVEIVSFLGRGATSVVYEARWQANPCVLKIISSEHSDSFDMEKEIATLDWAKESKHIPDMIAHGTLSGGEMFTLTTPVARPFGRSDLRVHHAISLVNVLEAAHTAGYVHRDVRPDNILLAESGVLLIDWGFAVSRGQDCPYRGTLCYASDRVLSHLENQDDEAFLVQPEDDLESLARSVCSLWDSNTGNELRQVPRNAGNLRHFWSSKQRIPKAWKTTKHANLRNSFDIWFPG